MQINRQTYEEFLLLYVDNELSPDDRIAVEDFLRLNPDLEQELVMLRESIFTPEKEIVFEYKESLLKNAPAASPINEINYEEYFVLYGDNELTIELQDDVEQFVYSHPQYQHEFELLLKVKLEPDNTVRFWNKPMLYRKEEDEKVIAFRWWKLAAAAILLLTLGTIGWYYSIHTKKDNNESAVAERKINLPGTVTEKQPAPGKSVENASKEKTGDVAGHLATDYAKTVEQQLREKPSPASLAKNRSGSSLLKRNIPIEKDQKPTDIQSNQTKGLQQTEETAINTTGTTDKISRPVDPVRSIPAPDKPANDVALNDNDIKDVHQTSLTDSGNDNMTVPETDAADNNTLYLANTSISKRNKLRGIFRTASRIIEKAVSLEPTTKSHAFRVSNEESGYNN